MTNAEIYIRDGLFEFLEAKIEIAKTELKEQGHRVTGGTEKSFRAEIARTGTDSYIGVIFVKVSAVILNFGVTPARVPFGGASTGAKTSKYIQALLDWAVHVKPNLDEKERKSFVFAVAHKAKKEGHPTKGSFSFSKNGRRKEWIAFSVDLTNMDIRQYIDPQILFRHTISDFK